MKAMASISLALLLGAMFMSLFFMALHMEMVGMMTDCPLLSHSEVICPMDIMEHMGTWKDIFMASLPYVELLLITLGVVILFTRFAPRHHVAYAILIHCYCKRLQAATYTFMYRALQELFSNGILNPKLF